MLAVRRHGAVTDLGINMEFDPVEALQSVFPGADPQMYPEVKGKFPAAKKIFNKLLLIWSGMKRTMGKE